ncbi:phage tail tape measure protein [Mycolicibacterium moriokaense]|nr:phage tail tape measure protein [Mycolicibacterium moriokaense]
MTDDFDRAGRRAGDNFQRALERPLSHIDTSAAAARAARGFSGAGAAAGRDFSRAVGDAMRGAISNATQQFGAFGSQADAVLGRISGKAGIAATGIAGVGLAAVAVGKQLYDLGAAFDDTFDNIVVRTGKVGAELESITGSVKRVAQTTAAPIESIGDTATRLAQTLGLTGAPLERLTAQLSDLQQMTGEAIDVRELSKAFHTFGVDVERNGVAVVDDLYKASQRTGQPIGELIATLRSAGPVARDLGLNLSQTAALLGEFEQAGIGSEVLRPALQRMAAEVGREGGNVRAELERIITDIATLPESAARAVAVDAFGTRNFESIFRAIRDGTLTVESLNKALASTGLSVEDARNQTADWQQELEKVINTLKTELEPVATAVFGGISTTITNFLIRPLSELNNLIKGNPLEDLPGWLGLDRTPPGPTSYDDHGRIVEVNPPKPIANPLDVLAGQGGGARVGGSIEELLAAPGAIPPPAPGAPAGVGGRAFGRPAIPNVAATDWFTGALRPWDPDGSGSGSGSQADFPTVPYTGDPMSLLQGFPVDSSLYSAASSVLDARHQQAQAEAKLNALVRDNTVEATAIQQARNELALAQRESFEAELRLNEAKQSATEKLTGTMQGAAEQVKGLTGELQQIGAEIDKDFGFSQGLPGILSNLFKLIANAAMAPVIGALSGVTSVYGTAGSGSGLLGLLSPRKSIFGEFPNIFGQYSEGMTAGPYGVGIPIDQAMQATQQQAGQWMGTGQWQLSGPAAALEALARSAHGGDYGWGASDLVRGLADCSGAISDLVEVLTTGTTSPGRLFDTSSAGAVLQSLGAVPGYMPGALNIGISHGGPGGGHMAATLPSGINFEAGGSNGGITYGGAAAGALDPQFTEHWALPVPGALPGATPTTSYTPGGVSAGGPGTGALFPGMAPPPAAIPGMTPFGSAMGTGAYSTPMMGRAYGEGRPAQAGFGLSGGGLLGMAMSGPGAVGGLLPGAGAGGPFIGQAAQIGIDEINRAISAGAELTGIAVEGLMETFSPVESELADPARGWAGRILGSIAGVSANVAPNIAGALTQQMNNGDQPLTPEQVAAERGIAAFAAQQAQQNMQVQVNVDNSKVPDIRSDAAVHQTNANMLPGGRT